MNIERRKLISGPGGETGYIERRHVIDGPNRSFVDRRKEFEYYINNDTEPKPCIERREEYEATLY